MDVRGGARFWPHRMAQQHVVKVEPVLQSLTSNKVERLCALEDAQGYAEGLMYGRRVGSMAIPRA